MKRIVRVKIVLICMLSVLAACGSASMERKEEVRKVRQVPENPDVCEVIQGFDFSVQEYSIDSALYGGEVEREFKNAFYEAVSNQVPMEYTDNGAVYFRDYLRGVGSYSDSEFLEELQTAQYRFIDMDGDGMPELAVQFGLELCILRYDMEEKRVERYFGPQERCKLLGSDRFGFFHTESAGLERYGYGFLGGSSGTEQIFYFERDTMYETLCTVTASGAVNGGAQVSEAEYLIHDVSGDGVPKLHIQTEENYYIFAYQEGRLFVWLTEKDYYGCEGRYDVLANGEVVYSVLQDGRESFSYWLLQPSAEIMVHFICSRRDGNGDGIYDEADIYQYDARTMEERYSMREVEDITMEEWMMYTADYLEIDENGKIRLRGALAWSVYDIPFYTAGKIIFPGFIDDVS